MNISVLRLFFYFALSTILFGCARQQPIVLVSASDQVSTNDDQPLVFEAYEEKTVGPKISVLEPRSLDVGVSPMSIRVRFEAEPGSRIRPETFRLIYDVGPFKKDITERVLGTYKPTESGLYIETASIPSGTHRFTLTIEDDLKRKGVKRIEIRVTG